MSDPLDIPDYLRMSQQDRDAAWQGRKLTRPREHTLARTKTDSPETVRLPADMAATAPADEERAAKKEARVIRQRQKAVLNPTGREPATEETEMKTASNSKGKKAVEKKAPAKAARRVKTERKHVRAKKAAKSPARTPAGKVDVVQTIADMMARKLGNVAAPLGGASMDEMVSATGILPHPMRAKIKLVRDRLGYTTTAPSKENDYRYHAEPPKKK